MARINVEDCFWIDPRLKALTRAVGCEFKAVGMCLQAWRLAQEFWKDGEGLIPSDLWALSGLEPLIACKLAKNGDGGIYVSGTVKHIDWLNERIAAAKVGGKASVEARKRKLGSAIPFGASNQSKTEPNVRNSRSTTEAKPKPLPLPPSLEQEDIYKPPTLRAGGTPLTDFDIATSQSWLAWAKERVPKIKANPQEWGTAIRRMREIDGLSEAEVAAVLAFVKGDEFWGKNALSPVSIRGRSRNGLTKLQNVRLAMERDGFSASGVSGLDEWYEQQKAKEARGDG